MPFVTPQLFYADPEAALRWLEKAFGLEIAMVVTDAQGNVGHCETTWRGETISLGAPLASPELIGAARLTSPRNLNGAGTQFLRLEVESDLDGHCERARAAGATITQAPTDQFYGQRTYRALDPEGHVWTFYQALAEVSPEVAEQGAGLIIKTSLE